MQKYEFFRKISSVLLQKAKIVYRWAEFLPIEVKNN